MPNKLDIDSRLSVGFSETTLARVDRLTLRLDPAYAICESNYVDPQRRQRLLRMMIDEASRALEELVERVENKADEAKAVQWFRFEVAVGQKPRAHEARLADERAVRELLAGVGGAEEVGHA